MLAHHLRLPGVRTTHAAKGASRQWRHGSVDKLRLRLPRTETMGATVLSIRPACGGALENRIVLSHYQRLKHPAIAGIIPDLQDPRKCRKRLPSAPAGSWGDQGNGTTVLSIRSPAQTENTREADWALSATSPFTLNDEPIPISNFSLIRDVPLQTFALLYILLKFPIDVY